MLMEDGRTDHKVLVRAILGRQSDLLRHWGWTQGAMAVDDRGDDIEELSPDACRFCLVGSLWRAFHDVMGISVGGCVVAKEEGWGVAKGTYAVLAECEQRLHLQVGRLAYEEGLKGATETTWNDIAGRKVEQVIACVDAIRG